MVPFVSKINEVKRVYDWETFNQWDKLSRNLLNDQDFIPVLCHHCDELELVVKPGGDEIYLVSTIENGPRIEKQGIYRLRRENHYHLEKNDESSICNILVHRFLFQKSHLKAQYCL